VLFGLATQVLHFVFWRFLLYVYTFSDDFLLFSQLWRRRVHIASCYRMPKCALENMRIVLLVADVLTQLSQIRVER